MKLFNTILFFVLLTCIGGVVISAQNPIFEELEAVKQQETFESHSLFQLAPKNEIFLQPVVGIPSNSQYLELDDKVLSRLRSESPDLLRLQIPDQSADGLELELYKADFLTDEFQVQLSSGNSFDSDYGLHYWGIVKGAPNSLVAISMGSKETMGFISYGKKTLSLAKIKNTENYVLTANEDYQIQNPFGCDVDMDVHVVGRNQDHAEASNPDNCIQMYVEIDNDLVNAKGGATPATDYVLGAFSQVAILYANETINFAVNEIFAWDTADPYTGPSTSDYLNQFRDNLGGNYNGDLAHLVGTQGSGGIAYVDVICNSTYGVAYSDINLSYADVPNYSWTVEVLTHEIGHNLGSRHTHDCVWNGNNTAIDGCGPEAGYNNSCGGGPLPAAGTIMSYCHLVSGIGIDFNLGFGPQPGDLIRSEVYNATCLTSCSAPTSDDAGISAVLVPTGTYCTSTVQPEVTLENFGTNTLTSVAIEYQIDNGTVETYNWTGSLATGVTENVLLPAVTFTTGSHTFNTNTLNPNGSADEDSSNDAASSSFTRQAEQTFYADTDGDGFGDPNNTVTACEAPNGYVTNADDCDDTNSAIYPGGSCDDGDPCTLDDVYDANCNCSGTPDADDDGDGVCNAIDVCPGGDDNIDLNENGIPDACECNEAQANFPNNPLTHSGSGSSSTTYAFAAGDNDVSFTISGLDAKTNGNPRNRYDEQVVVTYEDGNGNSQTYGTFLGSNTSTVSVSISGEVGSVTVSLSDANGTSSVDADFSVIDYCAGTPPCPDSDNDGVCDADDVCPDFDDNLIGTPCDDGDPCTIDDVYGTDCNCAGTYVDSDGDGVCDALDICEGGDDNIDTDGDGIPDFCDPSNCSNTITSNFTPDPLTHSGTGSSSSTVSFPSGNVDVDFTVTGLNSKTNGNPNGRFIDELVVTYVDGSGATITYGTFSGDQQSSASVSIAGSVQSVTLSLSDGYDGDASSLSVDPGEVSSCVNAEASYEGSQSNAVSVYPNPVQDHFILEFDHTVERGSVEVFDLKGRSYAELPIRKQRVLRVNTNEWQSGAQILLLRIQEQGQAPVFKKIVVIE